MKWVLLAVVLQTPVKTDLVFDTLDDCLRAEHEMRTAWGNAYSAAQRGGQASAAEKKKNSEFVTKQATWGTCIPSQGATLLSE
ncbi:MAG: hypothetical protein ACREUE_19640 [Panacagrimonas sp.]